MRAECRARDVQVAIAREPHERHVGLDAPAGVEQLRVDDRSDRAVDRVGAHAVEERARARPVDVDLRERGLVDQHRALARGEALGLDRRRPVPAGPAARPQRLVAVAVIRVEPVDALPAGLLAEARAVRGVPRIGRRDPQGPPRKALLAGVADVVVGRVHLGRAGERVRLGAVLAAEAADVHVPEVPLRLAVDDPLRHDLADPARPGQAVRAEPRGDPETRHLRLAEDEFAVGRERLGAVEELLDLGLLHRGHAPDGALHQLLEALVVPGQELRLEALGNAVEAERCGIALVAAHHETADLGAPVDEIVGVAQRRQRGQRRVERLGDQVLVGHRDDRDGHADQPRDIRRGHAGGVDHDLGLDLALVGHDAADPPAGVALDRGHARARVDLGAVVARAVGQRERQLARVEVAVARQERGAVHALGRHQRKALHRLGGGDDLERESERLGPAGLALDLLQPLGRRGEADAAELVPPGSLPVSRREGRVELDRVHHHPRQRHGRPQLADETGRVPGRAVGQVELLDQHDILEAELREVVGDAAATHAAADHHRSGSVLHRASLPMRVSLAAAHPWRTRVSGNYVTIDDILPRVEQLAGDERTSRSCPAA